jgi:hypothetical protein
MLSESALSISMSDIKSAQETAESEARQPQQQQQSAPAFHDNTVEEKSGSQSKSPGMMDTRGDDETQEEEEEVKTTSLHEVEFSCVEPDQSEPAEASFKFDDNKQDNDSTAAKEVTPAKPSEPVKVRNRFYTPGTVSADPKFSTDKSARRGSKRKRSGSQTRTTASDTEPSSDETAVGKSAFSFSSQIGASQPSGDTSSVGDGQYRWRQ